MKRLLVFVVLVFLTGCATYNANRSMNLSRTDPSKVSIKIGGLAISAYPLSKESVQEFFDEDLDKQGVLAVMVDVQNNTDNNAKLITASLNFEGQSATPMAPQDVYAIIKRSWVGPSIFWWFFGLYVGAPISAYNTHKTNLEIQEDLNHKILKFGEDIGKGVSGFMCFRVPVPEPKEDVPLKIKGALKLIFQEKSGLQEYSLDIIRE